MHCLVDNTVIGSMWTATGQPTSKYLNKRFSNYWSDNIKCIGLYSWFCLCQTHNMLKRYNLVTKTWKRAFLQTNVYVLGRKVLRLLSPHLHTIRLAKGAWPPVQPRLPDRWPPCPAVSVAAAPCICCESSHHPSIRFWSCSPLIDRSSLDVESIAESSSRLDVPDPMSDS